ncbi:ABC transporter permease [Chachezhania antarctica]|uniref:ABC transporter permease n=1 Tax=Chachezhania antarctica TaxID=2340860 RepID=UPI000EB0B1CA|nr:ABC transporter permease subunit [Chachezhania antarctica]|tara:strand:- start:3476 stop:4462 length:987 start_codon:yes stop_codon:yes gene_type:complete
MSVEATDPALAATGTQEAPARRVNRSLAGRIVFCAVVAMLCLLPFVMVLVISFGEKIEGAGWVFGFDLTNYRRFFVGADWPNSTSFLYLQKLGWSLNYAVIASVLAVVTAFPFTYFLTRLSRRAQTFWLVFLLSSLSLSEVFIVMGWDILLSARSGLPMVMQETGLTDWLKDVGFFPTLRDWGLASPRNVKFKTSVLATVLTMSYLVWPYAVILLYPALSRLDPALIEAARTMGARPWTVIRTVVIPSVKLALVGSVLLLFVFLLGTYVAVTVFAAPAQQTLAVSIYESVRGSTLNAPFGAAQSVILLVTAVVLLAIGQKLSTAGGRA